ncbi:MAG: hypothetical protein DCC68_12250 [Planctomycetota bacterium]|nr:MAG: hypothetical protein DCC68_12250 [Planctomycetota bacterium]
MSSRGRAGNRTASVFFSVRLASCRGVYGMRFSRMRRRLDSDVSCPASKRERRIFPAANAARKSQRGRSLRIEPLEARIVLDSTVVFNEIMYNPAGDGTPEWIELHNQMAVNVDVSNWKLADGVDFTFPAGTVVAGGGRIVISADPAALAVHTGFAGALGPFTGSLSNGGERIELLNHAGRVMDRLEYGDDNKWPSGPDGSGATLAKFNPQSGSEDPASWNTSVQMGGSPGAPNIPPPVTTEERTLLPLSSTWRYDKSGTDLGTAWRNVGYNDAGWESGPALLGVESAFPLATTFTPYVQSVRTYYFRTTFQFDGNLNGAELKLRHRVDDGAVFYLNGQEVSRFNMAAGAVTFSTLANVGVGDAALSGLFSLPTNLLVAGTNTFAVEVHQASTTSSDIVFGAELVLEKTTVNPGVGTPTVALNEIAAAGAAFQVELQNNAVTEQDLSGYVIAATGASGGEFVVPALSVPAGGYAAFTSAQLGFNPADGERLFLFSPDKMRVVDAATVRARARGRTPDGNWQYTSADTFGTANAFAFHDEIVINEIMYHHRPTFAEPAETSSATLVPMTGTWQFNQANVDLGTSWRVYDPDLAYDGWSAGTGLFYIETATLPAAKSTPLTPLRPTYYFRTTFDIQGDPADAVLQLRHIIDDGAVFYLNGTEFYRFNIAEGVNVTFNTNASVPVGDAVTVGPINIPSSLLQSGRNVLAVELHNIIPQNNDVVFGAEVTGVTTVSPASPFTESDEEWIELYNRSDHEVDIGGWRFDDAIHYTFPAGTVVQPGAYLVVSNDPAALAANYPGLAPLGPYSDGLSNSADRIVLEDTAENIADEVTYYQDGRWANSADGGGTSVELRDPDADNAQAEAWAPSDESTRSEWRHYEYTAIAIAPVYDPVTSGGDFREIRIGLLDSGDVLLDNLSVIENPGGTNVEMVQNGTFTADAIGGGANKWRFLGTHEGTHVAADPDDPTNKVLRIVAESKADYLDNLLETTTVGNLPIVPGRTYRISFDAKWLSGSPQLRTELYYNRVVKLDILDQPTLSGTPGWQNSTYAPNIGPTYENFRHGPAVPTASQPATVTVLPSDPDGVASMRLYYSVAGGAWNNVAMTATAGGEYAASIPGQAAGTVVQFYVQGQDALGAISTYPAAGPNSRALIKWNDGAAQSGARHNFRMIMTAADLAKMFTATNMMSNQRLGGTIVYDETEVFYDVGIRQRGSMFSRGNPSSTGYNIKFQPDHLFRGVHRSVTMKAAGRAEILVKHTALQVGVPEMYDDVIYMITASPGVSSVANMSMARYGDEYITTQYEDGGDGTVFKMQGIRVLLNNTGAESLKTYQPVGWISSYDLTNLGDDKEQYRWSIQIMNNRAKDDYGPLVDAMQALSLSGLQLEQAVDDYIDVDQWMRVFALQNLWGIGDAYMQGNPHNIDFYIRPSDGKLLALPWDWNFVASYGATSPLYGIENRNVTEVIDRPIYRRLYYGHMLDMIQTVYNPAYMTAWTTHYGSLTGESYGNYATYITQRGNYVLSQLNTVAPNVPFNITTPNGQQVNDTVATIAGDGWINVREIRVAGTTDPLDVTWTDFDSWQTTIPVAFGSNTIVLEALDHQGNVVGTDTVTVSSTVSSRPLNDFLRVTELMYHPADDLQFGYDADAFEFVELRNISDETTLDLSEARFTNGVAFDFAGSAVSSLAPGAYALVVSNAEAFALRYGSGLPVAGTYSGQLNNAGETVRLEDGDGVAIQEFTYDDVGEGWHPTTDGDGYSLVILDAAAPVATWNDPAAWRPSYAIGGSPAADDTPVLDGDLNGDLRVDLLDLAIVQANLGTLAGATRASGDLNGDAKVTAADAAILAQNFGRSAPSPIPSAPAAIVRSARSPRADRGGEPVPPLRLHAARRGLVRPQAVDAAHESRETVRERSQAVRTVTRPLRLSASTD